MLPLISYISLKFIADINVRNLKGVKIYRYEHPGMKYSDSYTSHICKFKSVIVTVFKRED